MVIALDTTSIVFSANVAFHVEDLKYHEQLKAVFCCSESD